MLIRTIVVIGGKKAFCLSVISYICFLGMNSNLNVNMDMSSIKEPQSRLRKWTTVDSISVNTSLDQNSSKHGMLNMSLNSICHNASGCAVLCLRIYTCSCNICVACRCQFVSHCLWQTCCLSSAAAHSFLEWFYLQKWCCDETSRDAVEDSCLRQKCGYCCWVYINLDWNASYIKKKKKKL